jgi:FMN phosphatase YigB (HAD superfamily)
LLFESDGAGEERNQARAANVAKVLNKFGLNVSLARVSLVLDETIDHLLRVWDRDKDVTHLEQLRSLVRFASNNSVRLRSEWIQELSAAYVSPLYELPPYVNPEASRCLQWLKNQKLRIGLICNTGLTPGFGLRRFLSERHVAEFFDIMVFSDEVGIRKPDPEIFLIAAKQLDARPHQIIHIGDNLKADIWGAKNAGFGALHLICEDGHDRKAQRDPRSLVARSRDLGKLVKRQSPDKTINSLEMAIETISEFSMEK